MAHKTPLTAVVQFEHIATEMGEYQENGTADCEEFADLKAMLNQTYEHLEDVHAEDALVPLLSSSNAYVRLHAATMLLLGVPSLALPVLERLKTETPRSKISRIATFTIGQWNNGFLFAYRRSKGRPAPSAKSVTSLGRDRLHPSESE